MDSVRSHSPEQCVALAFAARAGVAALAAVVMACSSGSNPVGSDAGTDTGEAQQPESGSEASVDDASPDDATDEAPASCTPISRECTSSTVCCAGTTCMPAGPGGSACLSADSGGPTMCLLAGEPCSSTESCCNGSGNCGLGTTNTCE